MTGYLKACYEIKGFRNIWFYVFSFLLDYIYNHKFQNTIWVLNVPFTETKMCQIQNDDVLHIQVYRRTSLKRISMGLILYISFSYDAKHPLNNLVQMGSVLIVFAKLCPMKHPTCHKPLSHDDVMKWEHFLRYWSFVRGILPVTGEFPTKRQVTRSFDVFFDLCLNKRLSKQSRGWWFETPSCSLWRHFNERHWIIPSTA